MQFKQNKTECVQMINASCWTKTILQKNRSFDDRPLKRKVLKTRTWYLIANIFSLNVICHCCDTNQNRLIPNIIKTDCNEPNLLQGTMLTDHENVFSISTQNVFCLWKQLGRQKTTSIRSLPACFEGEFSYWLFVEAFSAFQCTVSIILSIFR